MNAPCGHKEAVCVIHPNFWSCKVPGCDGTGKAEPEKASESEPSKDYWNPWAPWPPVKRVASVKQATASQRTTYSGNNTPHSGETAGWPTYTSPGTPPSACGHYVLYRDHKWTNQTQDRYFCYDCGSLIDP